MSTPQLLPCWSCRTSVLATAGECPACAARLSPTRAIAAPIPQRRAAPIARGPRWVRVDARSQGPRATLTQLVRRHDAASPPCSVTLMSATVQTA